MFPFGMGGGPSSRFEETADSVDALDYDPITDTWRSSDGRIHRTRFRALKHQTRLDNDDMGMPPMFVGWLGFRPCWGSFMGWMSQVSLG